MISRLHHVQITIPSAGEAVARGFYLDLLKLTEIPKPDSLKSRDGFWLSLAGQEIHVSPEDGINRFDTKAHLAYQVTDIWFWRSTFEAAGFEVTEGVAIPGFDRFKTRDPFGNRLELITEKRFL